MKKPSVYFIFIVLSAIWLGSCKQDLGPYREVNRSFSQTSFDRLNMGSGFHVDVQSGGNFAIAVRGNETDVNDLDLTVRNSTLHVEYRNSGRKQRYDTYFTITMPTVRAVNFSGAVKSTITGFTDLNELDVVLSGASKSDISLNATRLTTSLSGASTAIVVGNGTTLTSEVSGASKLETYDFPVTQADLDVSGASTARVRVKDALTVKASGASKVWYRGTPRVNSNISGASTLTQE